MRKSYHKRSARAGSVWVFLLLVLIAGIGILGWKVFSHEAPVIRFTAPVKGIGKQTTIAFVVHDEEYSLKNVTVEIQQGNRRFSVPSESEIRNAPSPPWWKFWAKPSASSGNFKARIGHKSIPDLKEGRATLEVVATNDSWGRFFRGGRSNSSTRENVMK